MATRTPLSPDLAAAERECLSRSYLYGLATGAFTFAGFYFGQKSLSSKIKGFSQPVLLISSGLFGAVAGYLVINHKVYECHKTALQEEANRNRTQRMLELKK